MKRLLLFLLVALSSSVGVGAVFPSGLVGTTELQSEEGKPLRPLGPADRTLSPYFYIEGGDASVDQLPLKSTSASVDITGVIAQVRVTQVYRNEGRRTLEAVYIFPGSTRAAVHGMTMKIGERVITAKIEERQEARRQYQAAQDAGQTASLLEQQRPNVFQMNVANILPGDEIKVDLVYTELLVPENHVYEFVYPTVVGPRYSTTPAAGAPDSERWVQNPYLHSGAAPTSTFSFRARIVAGMSLREVSSPSHQIDVTYQDPRRATIALPSTERFGANRDVVLRYRLAEDRIETGLLLAEGGDEHFFLCTLEPPQRFEADQMPPREYVFVMDVSGSMNGFPLETSKTLLRAVLARLRPTDSFNVIFFSGGSYVLSPSSVPATEANKAWAIQEIDHQRGGGGTELLPALRRAFDLARARQDISRVIVVATDGYVNVEREAFTLIREHLSDANLFAFGIGSSVNRHLIEGMAHVGEGEPFVVLNESEAQRAAARFVKYIESPLLSHVRVETPGFAAYDIEPARIPDLFAERPLVIVGKYHGEPAGEIVVTGYTGRGRFEQHIKVGPSQVDSANDGLKYLWARERVRLLSDFRAVDESETDRLALTALGLKYSLLTEFTSFVAIDQRVRRQDGTIETVRQPLPMPQGVSDLAVGGPKGFVVAERAMYVARMPAAAAATDMALMGGRPSNLVAPLAPPPPPPPPVSPAIRVRVLDMRLAHQVPSDTAAIGRVLTKAFEAEACLAGAVSQRGSRVKIFFDARGQATRAEILDVAAVGDTRALRGCLDAAIRRGITLGTGAEGYVVVLVERGR
jgi:Ca-activated chloride channel family protein